jgi:threonine dehydratase
MARSLQAGRVVHVTASSIAKTLGAPYVAEHALAVARQHLEGVTVVSDREAFGALVVLLERAKVFTEPAASCTLAAAERLAAHFSAEHHVALVLCGGNAALGDVLRWRDQFPS